MARYADKQIEVEMAKEWRNRIVGYGEEAPDQLLANPKNFRIHPKNQRDALLGAINDIGFIEPVLVNRRTGFVVNGHLRVALAISERQKVVPVAYLDLSEEEEAEALATIDPLGAMADKDAAQLDSLLREFNTADEALQKMLNDLAGIAYLPDYNPTIGIPDHDAVDIERAGEKLQGAFNSERALVEIMCPHCGSRFHVDRA